MSSPGSEQALSLKRLLWQMSGFLLAFVLLISGHFVFGRLIGDLDVQIANEEARLFIGERITRQIQDIQSRVYRVATIVGIRGQRIALEEIEQAMIGMRESLRVLERGGRVSQQLRLNLVENDLMIREVAYSPDPSQQGLVLEVIDLEPKIESIARQVEQLSTLLEQRESYREQGDQAARMRMVDAIKRLMAEFGPSFTRLEENANRLFFQSHQQLAKLRADISARQRFYLLFEAAMAGLIALFVTLFGYVLAKQIAGANRRLQLARDAMEQAKEEAEKASAAKSELLSRVSHELRTPLNAMLGFNQLIGYEPQVTPGQREAAAQIERAGAHLLEMINELLDLSRIEHGQFEMTIEAVALGPLLEDCARIMEPLARAGRVQLLKDLAHSDLTVAAGRTRLRQVALNLISNAIKYNHEGGSVWISLEQRGDHARIGIRDDGRGIPRDRLEELFEPFNRLGADALGVEGSGIGLSLTEQLVRLMHGEIGVESTPGEGSFFWVDLPRVVETSEGLDSQATAAPPATPGMPTPVASTPAGEIRGCRAGRLLVAEDNAINRALIERQLGLLGYECVLATNGVEALERLEAQDFALLLTDISMPEMDGYALAAAIRGRESLGSVRIPILAFTANATPADAERCLAAGMDDYIAKPVTLEALKDKLEQWMPATEAEGPVQAGASAHATGDQAEHAVSRSVIQALTGDVPKLHRSILQIYLDHALADLEQLELAVRAAALSEAKALAHKCKSAARSIGAAGLGQLCEAIEQAASAEDAEAARTLSLRLAPQAASVARDVADWIADLDVELGAGDEDVVADRPALGKAMIVDDDPLVLQMVGILLRQLGVSQVLTARNGAQALERLGAHGDSTDLIVCDLSMPGMDGVTFLRFVRETSFAGRLVLMSGEDERVLKTASDVALAHSLNLAGVLQKPVSLERLQALLSKSDRGARQARPASGPGAQLSLDALRAGISDGSLRVYYQPQVSTTSGRVLGLEALARYVDARLGSIAPAELIPLAEEGGLIDELTAAVCAIAVNQLGAWKSAGFDVKVAVNFSMHCLNRLDLPEWLEALVTAASVEPGDVVVEVTESGLMTNEAATLEVLSRIKLKGFHLSIDDFGTGYSTLKQLQQLPFSELKIDRSFVGTSDADATSRAIFESSVELAKRMKLLVVAEGVETQANLDLAASLGCDVAQGYFIAKPMSADDCTAWMAAQSERMPREGAVL